MIYQLPRSILLLQFGSSVNLVSAANRQQHFVQEGTDYHYQCVCWTGLPGVGLYPGLPYIPVADTSGVCVVLVADNQGPASQPTKSCTATQCSGTKAIIEIRESLLTDH